jgi:poly(ADP-ribose) glycohydrolase ARH3
MAGMNEMTIEQFEGCLLGLALGDVLGAPYEGGPVERLLWRIIGTTRQGLMRWTDDTQMSVDVAESLLARGELDPDDLALRFACSYRWSRGYGPGAARLLKRIAGGADWRQANCSVYPEGSFGNGGAMRAPMVGLFYARRLDDLVGAARLSAKITHAHPLGMEGAVLVAMATALALRGNYPPEILQGAGTHCELEPFTTRIQVAARWLQTGEEPATKEVITQLGNGIAASESCVTAVYIALRFMDRSFQEMQEFVAKGGGDADTIGAMAGAVWGTANGSASLPPEKLAKLEQREKLLTLASALYARRLT